MNLSKYIAYEMQPYLLSDVFNQKYNMQRITLFTLLLFFGISTISVANVLSDTETRKLGNFSEVSVSNGIKLYLIPGNENKAVIEVEDMELEDVVTDIQGDRLVIKVSNRKKWGWNWKSKRIEVTLTYKNIEEIAASSGSNVSSDQPLEADELEFDTSSGASISLEIKGKKVSAESSSGSSIRLAGSTRTLDVEVSSGASIKAEDLEADEVDAEGSSGGSIRVWAKSELDADVSSGASVRYKGNPSKISKDKSSGGSVSPL
jgi:hypothetical protein